MHQILSQPKRWLRWLGLVLVVAYAAVPVAAGAKTPSVPRGIAHESPSVFVRVEGASATLLAQKLVNASGAGTLRGQTCPGSSAAAALNVATGGHWDGSYS